jgi:spore coat protein A
VAQANQARFPGVDYYQIEVGEYRQVLHPDFYKIYGTRFPGTKFWGYADTRYNLVGGQPNHRYLGGLIVGSKGRPVRMNVSNNLAGKRHPLPVDYTIPFSYFGVGGGLLTPFNLENRIAVHLHGGLVPWMSDGGPFHWIGPSNLTRGPSVVRWLPGALGLLTDDYWYPMNQSARLLWYHDHAVGITRLNAYAGIASGFLVTDDYEQGLIGTGIPSRLVPLILQDKSFIPLAGNNQAGGRGNPGDLWYPSVYEKASAPTGRWDWAGDAGYSGVRQPPIASCIPEFFGDTTVINGSLYPFLEVEQNPYRFLLLNGSQARFYNLGVYYADPLHPTEVKATFDPQSMQPVVDPLTAGPPIVQIGTEGGFLPAPLTIPATPFSASFDLEGNYVPGTMSGGLILGPGERADVMIDFSTVQIGSKLILYTDTPSPFPGGDSRNDYFTGAPDLSSFGGARSPRVGFGPNTRTMLQFRVVQRAGSQETIVPPPLLTLDPAPLYDPYASTPPAWVGEPTPLVGDIGASISEPVAVIRDLTLNEVFDKYGRLTQQLGTNVATGTDSQSGAPLFNRDYFPEPATETPAAGTVEVWRIFNLTGDTHPIHFHLVNVQVIARQAFVVASYNGTPNFMSDAVTPDLNERGWKETVRMNPGECTTVVMKFDIPALPASVTTATGRSYPVGPYPTSPRTGGYEYVWHCHILEHEEHDMMRPLVVQP